MKTVFKSLLKSFLTIIGKDRIRDLLFDDVENKLFNLKRNSYLESTGWIKSYESKQPLDKEGKPVPWVTYSFIYFIKDRLNPNLNLFEFGSGNSTIFFSNIVQTVTSVEHNLTWYNNIKERKILNSNIYFEKLEYGGTYSMFATATGKKYHLIIVDGRDRVNCCINSLEALTNDGILILDDSQRESYKTAIDYLLNNSFKKIDFWGIAPGISYNKCTSIFYRDNNILNI